MKLYFLFKLLLNMFQFYSLQLENNGPCTDRTKIFPLQFALLILNSIHLTSTVRPGITVQISVARYFKTFYIVE